ncbi:MAG: sulfite exporter TauE/SafE family protein, partial [Bacteroidota bacterium]
MMYSAFLVGLLGSFHCLGMCAPLVLSLPEAQTFRHILYNLGRVTAYTLMGSVVGLIGQALLFVGLQFYLSLSLGILMVIVGLLAINLDTWVAHFPWFRRWQKFITSHLGTWLKRKGNFAFLMVGFFNGFLPCGLVYLALLGAVAAGDAVSGATYMAFFGLGTIPMMLFSAVLGKYAFRNWRSRIRKLYPYAFVLLGFFLIV